jgi:hypothetical protein
MEKVPSLVNASHLLFDENSLVYLKFSGFEEGEMSEASENPSLPKFYFSFPDGSTGRGEAFDPCLFDCFLSIVYNYLLFRGINPLSAGKIG